MCVPYSVFFYFHFCNNNDTESTRVLFWFVVRCCSLRCQFLLLLPAQQDLCVPSHQYWHTHTCTRSRSLSCAQLQLHSHTHTYAYMPPAHSLTRSCWERNSFSSLSLLYCVAVAAAAALALTATATATLRPHSNNNNNNECTTTCNSMHVHEPRQNHSRSAQRRCFSLCRSLPLSHSVSLSLPSSIMLS